MLKFDFKQAISFKKIISSVLLFTIIISQTIRVDFFPSTNARVDNYRDIVSIIVDKKTYDNLRSEITRYSEDIVKYLGHTQVVVMVTNSDTIPAEIAANNEKLYYEGLDGIDSRLVGTILIGDIPVPMVSQNGSYFPSLFPYVDFDNKAFVYDENSKRFIASKDNSGARAVEIWHGVINPRLGGNNDISDENYYDYLKNFFEKTKVFYDQNHPNHDLIFSKEKAPRVFYFDGFTEKKGMDTRSVRQYKLNLENSENQVYGKLTKEVLRDVNSALKNFDKQNDANYNELISSVIPGMSTEGGDIDDNQINDISDVYVPTILSEIFKDYYETINKKVLGEELAAVHNAGRYNNGGTVNADLVATRITLIDEEAKKTVKIANDIFKEVIDDYITRNNFARRIPIADNVKVRYSSGFTYSYDNYFFGENSKNINKTNYCSIARGYSGDDSMFGRSILTEANVAFDVKSVQNHINILKNDKRYGVSCMDPMSLDTYWGGNSLLKNSNFQSGSHPLKPTGNLVSKGFILPIYSTGGMTESDRINNPSITQCMDYTYQYTVLNPYVRVYYDTVGSGDNDRTIARYEYYPEDTDGTYYSCRSKLRFANSESTFGNNKKIQIDSNIFNEYKKYKEDQCLVGNINIDGKTALRNNNSCIRTETISDGDGHSETIEIDETNYRDISYHTIDPLFSHISPTIEEIDAISENGATQSLPVDEERFVEFITQKGQVVRFDYVDFFNYVNISDNTSGIIMDHLPGKLHDFWEGIYLKENEIEQDEDFSKFLKEYLGVDEFTMKARGDHARFFNELFIDEKTGKKIFNAIIPQKAIDWLALTIEQKNKLVVEASLSDNARDIFEEYVDISQVITTDFYDIAYLGLEKVVPPKGSFDASEVDSIIKNNSEKLSEIKALNIATSSDNSNNISSSEECGPPDGVDLFKWPNAISCWIKKQMPPKISTGYCAARTIGLGDSYKKPTQDSAVSKTTEEQKNFFKNITPVSNFSSTNASYNETIIIKTSLETPDNKIIPPKGTTTKIIIDSVVVNGKEIPENDYGIYFSLENNEITSSSPENLFYLKSKNNNVEITLHSITTIHYLDGTTGIFEGEKEKISISDSYLDIVLTNSKKEQIPVIYSDSDEEIFVNAYRKSANNSDNLPEKNFSIKILDDINNSIILENQKTENGQFLIPKNIISKPGSYRIILSGENNIYGQTTFSVRSGKLANLSISSTSSAIIKDSTTIATLSLLDAKGNSVPLDLYSASIKVENGYIIDSDGNAKDSMNVDIFDSYFNFNIKSINGNNIKIIANVNGISTEKIINVYDSAQIKVQMEGIPKVGGNSIPMRIIVADSNGNQIQNFSSVLSIEIPSIAGNFSKNIINILNGQSEVFEYVPGRVSGLYNLILSIPGVGISDQNPITILPGDGMYVDFSIKNDKIIFYVRDRFGNISSFSGEGKVSVEGKNPYNINFIDGIAEINKEIGQVIVDVPALENNKINYSDSNGNHSILASSKNAFISNGDEKFYEFKNNHNSLYTVLAGGQFLKEASDILYGLPISDWRDSLNLWKSNEAKEVGRALAVSTLLGSPYSDDNLFSIFPGGGYSVGFSNDSIIEAKLNLERGYPVISVFDSVNGNNFAKVLYRTNNSQFQICNYDDICKNNSSNSVISGKILSDVSNFSFVNQQGALFLTSNNLAFLAIKNDGSIQKDSSIDIDLKEYDTNSSFVMEVKYQGNVVAEISYSYPEKNSVTLANDLFTSPNNNSPVLMHISEQIEEFSDKVLNGNVKGYRIFKYLPYKIFDDTKISPNNIDDIGTLSENPGVGWMGDNRMLLSFASGDTVGEATKWFHTYMFVNLGDPVANLKHNVGEPIIDGLDRTTGTHLTDSRRASIHDFFQKDMNNDGLTDIVVQYIDGYVELLINLGGKFRSMGNIAYIPNLTNSKILVADFTGDKYSDIAILNSDGEISILSNNDRKFTTEKIFIENNETAPIRIQQFKSYDMDADGRDDIVYLTSAGELGILYGTEKSANFSKKILDSTLGISLSDSTDDHGGAITASNIKQYKGNLATSDKNEKNLSDSVLLNEVYYQHQESRSRNIESKEFSENTDLDQYFPKTGLDNSLELNEDIRDFYVPATTYLKSQYASIAEMNIFKKYFSTNNTLYPDDIIKAEINIKNNSSEIIKNIKYLDTIPSIFARDNSITYDVVIDGKNSTKNISELNFGNYNLSFEVGDLPAGATAKIIYTLKVLPASYGEMQVGDFEKGLVGADNYGDVIFKTSTTCGAEMMSWLSSDSREYVSSKTKPTFSGIPLPDSVSSQVVDSDNNGFPDNIDNFAKSREKQNEAYKEIVSSNKQNIVIATKSKNEDSLSYDFRLNEEYYKKTSKKVQEIADGLSCGFGGGSCMTFPINWAPLAPGSDPVVLGTPVGDGLNVDEGLPIFSALTGVPVYNPSGCFEVPSIWPVSPLGLPGACSGKLGAGGYLGVDSPTNFLRIFVTPTLTLGMGTAVCLGAPASSVGGNPGKGLSPLVQGGNCIVITKAMPVCKGDGSKEDGDVSIISGLTENNGSGIGATNTVWNGESCNLQAPTTTKLKQSERDLEKEIIEYFKSPSQDKIAKISAKFSKSGGISSLNAGPLLTIGNSSDASEIFIDSNTSISDFGKIINPKNIRIAAFPDFVMDWLTRQTDEIVNSLFTPPNLTVIPPTDFGQNAQVDSTYSDFIEKLGKSFSNEALSELTTQMGDSYKNTNISNNLTNKLTVGGDTTIGEKYNNFVESISNSDVVSGSANSIAGGLNSIKSAYNFLGKMPFLNISTKTVNINVPWILPRELDQYERQLEEYKETINETMQDWCVDDNTAECISEKGKLQNSGLLSSINANLKRIEEYRNFPDKLQKYINWKEELMYQILCNVELIEKMTFGWVRDNGIRFEKWAELYVLIKAIAESWQPVLDIFADMNASCGVCRNERYNSQYWKFKIISAIIPSIPVINFPKWPDIVLDLSDIKFGINVIVPEFNFKLSPIRLPNLPGLSLPNSPNASLKLPTIPILPSLPELPDLPELPSLPYVKLPDLPPPPKLPKLGGAIKASTDILKLIAKMYCYYQKTFLIPEWQVGDVIAQRTERQGTLPFDFLQFQLPQFSLPSIKEIRVSSHVNYDIDSDFIAEYAKNAVKPINEFSTDLSKGMPSQIGNDVNISSPVNNIRIDASSPEALDRSIERTQNNLENSTRNFSDSVDNSFNQNLQSFKEIENILDPIIAEFEADKDVFMTTDEFYSYFRENLVKAGLNSLAYSLDSQIAAARLEANKTTKDIQNHISTRVNLLKSYINEQNQNIAEMQNFVDLLRDENNLLANADFAGKFVSNENNSKKSLALSQIEALDIRALEKISSISRDITDISGMKNQMIARVDRIVQATANENNGQEYLSKITNSNVDTSYLPKFKGMYVLTEKSNTQTKLFDYTELVNPKDRVDTIDIDNDGDRDYIFVLGGVLYIKNTHLNSPQKIIDTKITITNITSKIPEVANNFVEIISTPSEINASFKNTVAQEKEWRLEFFDKYLEWNRASVSNNFSTPKTTVDLFLKSDFVNSNDPFYKTSPITRTLIGGYGDSGFVLEGPKITKIEVGQYISISPGRTIYTTNRHTDIKYKKSSGEEFALRLESNTAYQFSETLEMYIANSPIYIIGGAGSHKYTSADNLEGLPIIAGMKLISSDSSLVIRDNTHSSNLIIDKNSLYITKNINNISGKISFSLSYPNGYYYARLHHLSNLKNDRAGVILLSPQLSSDSSAPIVSIDSVVRVPVYAETRYNFSDIITELSSYTVTVDEDISQDEDNNSIFDDDFVSKGKNISINNSEIIFGKYDSPGNKNIILKVRDENGNTTLVPVVVEVFTPIANLENATVSGFLDGKLDTIVEGEPIDFFRVRNSEVPIRISENPVISLSGGLFSSGIALNDEKIIASSSTSSWNISPNGIIENLPNGFDIRVNSASAFNPMSIEIFDNQNISVYKQFISLPANSRIVNFDSDSSNNVIISTYNGYNSILSSVSDPSLSGGAYITDKDQNPIALISRDGNIYLLNSDLSLRYSPKNNYLNFSIIKDNQTIADFTYKINFFFTKK